MFWGVGTKRSDQITGEKGGVKEETAWGNGKHSRTGVAKKLNASRAHGIMG